MNDHDDFIHVYMKIKSMYYILLLSQMSKLQFCSENNYAAIFQLNSFPDKILFFELQIGNFFWKLGKKEDILDRELGLYSAPGDREKRPCPIRHCVTISSA